MTAGCVRVQSINNRKRRKNKKRRWANSHLQCGFYTYQAQNISRRWLTHSKLKATGKEIDDGEEEKGRCSHWSLFDWSEKEKCKARFIQEQCDVNRKGGRKGRREKMPAYSCLKSGGVRNWIKNFHLNCGKIPIFDLNYWLTRIERIMPLAWRLTGSANKSLVFKKTRIWWFYWLSFKWWQENKFKEERKGN